MVPAPDSFWQRLPRPLIGLAPMDGVTDAPFRLMAAKYGRPDLTYTEFTAAEGIRAGALRLLQDFAYDQRERPVLAQLFGSDPSAFRPAAAVAAQLGFDGIDVNMGCPAKNVTQRGAGAALIDDEPRAAEILRMCREALDEWAGGAPLESFGVHDGVLAALPAGTGRRWLPLSVKTRLGTAAPTIARWASFLAGQPLSAVALHGRTLRQGYTGIADWSGIAEGAALLRMAGLVTLGNGDVRDLADANCKVGEYGLDGVLVGRAAQGNPWFFSGTLPEKAERARVALEHARAFEKMFGRKQFVRMRKHLFDYARGFEGAHGVRKQLMRAVSAEETAVILAPLLI